MAEVDPQAGAVGSNTDEEEYTAGYKTPKAMNLQQIRDFDQEDESLVKYKAQLLGVTEGVKDAGGQNVIVQKLIFAAEGRPDVELDLTGDLKLLKKQVFTVKEGTKYKLKVKFRVQREIVSGLRYVQATYRKGIRVDRANFMVGSYGPKTEGHVFTTPPEDAPSGLLSRGIYTVKSNFTDDDKNSILQWEWGFDIKKDWDK